MKKHQLPNTRDDYSYPKYKEVESKKRSLIFWRNCQRLTESFCIQTSCIKSNNLRVSDDNLVVPLHDINNKLWSLQLISADGNTSYFGNYRRRHDVFYQFGKIDSKVIIAIDFVTATVIYEATRIPTIAVFELSDLRIVARIIRYYNLNTQIVIAADHDKRENHFKARYGSRNFGLEKAKTTAKTIEAQVAKPSYKKCWPRKYTFQNQYLDNGLDSVRQSIREAFDRH